MRKENGVHLIDQPKEELKGRVGKMLKVVLENVVRELKGTFVLIEL